MFKETKSRSIIKTISWRLSATLITMLLVFVFVKRVDIAAAVGGLEVILKLFFYYFHERIWDKIAIGKHQVEPFVLWFTGLASSGKSTLANNVYDYLIKKGYKVEQLDGDAVRSIFPETGFDKESRDNHIKKVGFVASMLEKNGVIVIASFISPYEETRNFVRSICNNFIEVFVSTSLEECEQRDVKGLYKKARAGEIKQFTGIDAPYEPPKNPDLLIKTEENTVKESFEKIIKNIQHYL